LFLLIGNLTMRASERKLTTLYLKFKFT